MRKDRVGWEESAYSRVCLIDIMAKGLGTYSAEGAYWSLGAYLRLWYMMKICGFEKKNACTGTSVISLINQVKIIWYV